jgi:hypothetical protein
MAGLRWRSLGAERHSPDCTKRSTSSVVGWVERSETHRCFIRGDKEMGFASLYPSLYEQEAVFCRCFVRNGPAWVATQAGPPIVGS